MAGKSQALLWLEEGRAEVTPQESENASARKDGKHITESRWARMIFSKSYPKRLSVMRKYKGASTKMSFEECILTEPGYCECFTLIFFLRKWFLSFSHLQFHIKGRKGSAVIYVGFMFFVCFFHCHSCAHFFLDPLHVVFKWNEHWLHIFTWRKFF